MLFHKNNQLIITSKYFTGHKAELTSSRTQSNASDILANVLAYNQSPEWLIPATGPPLRLHPVQTRNYPATTRFRLPLGGRWTFSFFAPHPQTTIYMPDDGVRALLDF